MKLDLRIGTISQIWRFGDTSDEISSIQRNESPRSKLRGISSAEFIDLIEASFEEFTRRN